MAGLAAAMADRLMRDLFCAAGFGGCGHVRRATHSGSWYPDDPEELRADLQGLLAKVQQGCAPGGPPKALIVPHAGLRHCGRTAAHAYKRVDPSAISRVVVLGTSHRKRLKGCALPAAGVVSYATPFQDVPLDLDAIEELRDTGEFEELSLGEDEAEHSIEMQLPFTALQLEQNDDWELLPVIVGRLSADACASYAKHLAPYFHDPSTLFIISSDFCHWGAKFRFQPELAPEPHPAGPVSGMGHAGRGNPVNSGIEALDLRGIGHICRQDLEAFSSYLREEGNTICGQSSIRLLLEFLSARPGGFRVRFLHYSQSRLLGAAPGPGDSTVSYAAGICEAAQ